MKRKTCLITGASSGIGAEAVRLFRAAGYDVWGACRRPVSDCHWLELDLSRGDSIEAVAKAFAEQAGQLDVLINNAGYGLYGPVERIGIEEARREMEVDVIGAIRLTQLLLPLMRKAGGGRILNTSSIAGRLHTAYGGWYHAAKFALEGISDCMRVELKPFNIQVILIEPGLIRTSWDSIACRSLQTSAAQSPYEPTSKSVAHTMEQLYASRYASRASKVAHTMLKAATCRRPKARYLTGFGATTLVMLRRWLPTRLYDYLLWRIEAGRR